ncbi:MAG: enoyl-CoA hydratase/isomerase family protein, partial [Clostridiales bacterium]|nr:enoyl-CoA hydratase/isomerase family protein [Clostridiales bacterium]
MPYEFRMPNKEVCHPGAPVDHVPLEVYSEKYKDHIIMERRNGILLMRLHCNNRPIVWTRGIHRAVHQAVREASSDPENQVIMITGTGNYGVAYGLDASSMKEQTPEDSKDAQINATFTDYVNDGMPLQENIVFDTNVPTIGLCNGPGYHNDLWLNCDLTICTDDTVMFDVHRWMGFVSGDGINIAMQELMGSKRAAYYMMTGEAVTAEQALEWGMVNKVVPRDQLIDEGWKLAEKIMRGGDKSRAWRRFMTEIVRKPMKIRMSQDFAAGFAMEMYAYIADDGVSHSDDALIESKSSIMGTLHPRPVHEI